MIDILKLKNSLPVELGKIELFGETFDVSRKSERITNDAVGIAYRAELARLGQSEDSPTIADWEALGAFVSEDTKPQGLALLRLGFVPSTRSEFRAFVHSLANSTKITAVLLLSQNGQSLTDEGEIVELADMLTAEQAEAIHAESDRIIQKPVTEGN